MALDRQNPFPIHCLYCVDDQINDHLLQFRWVYFDIWYIGKLQFDVNILGGLDVINKSQTILRDIA